MGKDRKSWNVSPYNQEAMTSQGIRLPGKVILHDATLRDGEQTPGVVFNKDARLKIAKALDQIGVHRVEAGFPVASNDDREGVTAVVNAGLSAEIWGFGRCLKHDVDVNIDCGVKNIVLEIPISDLKLAAYSLNKEIVKSRLLESLEQAKNHNLYVGFMPVDLTRADIKFAEEIITLAVEKGGANEIIIVDSIGVANPDTISWLTRRIRGWTDVPLNVHCHNDFGLALANSISAIREGAYCVHVCVNGLGERAGNTDLAETVLALQLLYGLDMGIHTEQLRSVSQLVEELSGHSISLTKPVTGKMIFSRESGGVVQQLLRSPAAVEPFEPELVGLSREIVLGKMSGTYSIMHALTRLGLNVQESQIDELLTRVKSLSTREHRLITDEEFLAMVKAINSGVT